jgi:hypothetical protein
MLRYVFAEEISGNNDIAGNAFPIERKYISDISSV